MYIIKRTAEFDTWLGSLKDNVTRIRLRADQIRRNKATQVTTKPIGSGVVEMRENFGAGWRMYFIQYDDVLIVMLGGGSKSGQS